MNAGDSGNGNPNHTDNGQQNVQQNPDGSAGSAGSAAPGGPGPAGPGSIPAAANPNLQTIEQQIRALEEAKRRILNGESAAGINPVAGGGNQFAGQNGINNSGSGSSSGGQFGGQFGTQFGAQSRSQFGGSGGFISWSATPSGNQFGAASTPGNQFAGNQSHNTQFAGGGSNSTSNQSFQQFGSSSAGNSTSIQFVAGASATNQFSAGVSTHSGSQQFGNSASSSFWSASSASSSSQFGNLPTSSSQFGGGQFGGNASGTNTNPTINNNQFSSPVKSNSATGNANQCSGGGQPQGPQPNNLNTGQFNTLAQFNNFNQFTSDFTSNVNSVNSSQAGSSQFGGNGAAVNVRGSQFGGNAVRQFASSNTGSQVASSGIAAITNQFNVTSTAPNFNARKSNEPVWAKLKRQKLEEERQPQQPNPAEKRPKPRDGSNTGSTENIGAAGSTLRANSAVTVLPANSNFPVFPAETDGNSAPDPVPPASPPVPEVVNVVNDSSPPAGEASPDKVSPDKPSPDTSFHVSSPGVHCVDDIQSAGGSGGSGENHDNHPSSSSSSSALWNLAKTPYASNTHKYATIHETLGADPVGGKGDGKDYGKDFTNYGKGSGKDYGKDFTNKEGGKGIGKDYGKKGKAKFANGIVAGKGSFTGLYYKDYLYSQDSQYSQKSPQNLQGSPQNALNSPASLQGSPARSDAQVDGNTNSPQDLKADGNSPKRSPKNDSQNSELSDWGNDVVDLGGSEGAISCSPRDSPRGVGSVNNEEEAVKDATAAEILDEGKKRRKVVETDIEGNSDKKAPPPAPNDVLNESIIEVLDSSLEQSRLNSQGVDSQEADFGSGTADSGVVNTKSSPKKLGNFHANSNNPLASNPLASNPLANSPLSNNPLATNTLLEPFHHKPPSPGKKTASPARVIKDRGKNTGAASSSSSFGTTSLSKPPLQSKKSSSLLEELLAKKRSGTPGPAGQTPGRQVNNQVGNSSSSSSSSNQLQPNANPLSRAPSLSKPLSRTVSAVPSATASAAPSAAASPAGKAGKKAKAKARAKEKASPAATKKTKKNAKKKDEEKEINEIDLFISRLSDDSIKDWASNLGLKVNGGRNFMAAKIAEIFTLAFATEWTVGNPNTSAKNLKKSNSGAVAVPMLGVPLIGSGASSSSTFNPVSGGSSSSFNPANALNADTELDSATKREEDLKAFKKNAGIEFIQAACEIARTYAGGDDAGDDADAGDKTGNHCNVNAGISGTVPLQEVIQFDLSGEEIFRETIGPDGKKTITRSGTDASVASGKSGKSTKTNAKNLKAGTQDGPNSRKRANAPSDQELINAIQENEMLWERMLCFEPVQVLDVQTYLLQDKGIKIGVEALKDFLLRECVVFSY